MRLRLKGSKGLEDLRMEELVWMIRENQNWGRMLAVLYTGYG